MIPPPPCPLVPVNNNNNRNALAVTRTSPQTLQITTNTPTGTTWTFDLARGCLVSWRRGNDATNILAGPPTFEIYRALTNNDAGGDDPNGTPGSQGRQWRDARVHLAHDHPSLQQDRDAQQPWEQERTADGTDVVEITAISRLAPPVLGWGIDITSTYRFMANSNSNSNSSSSGGDDDNPSDALYIRIQAKASGPWVPPNIPRFGLVMNLRGCHSVSWFGRGPGESYRDKKESQLVGTYSSTIDGLFTNYEVPQDNGNRSDVRWVEFRSAATADDTADVGTGVPQTDDGPRKEGRPHGNVHRRLLRASFGDLDGASFSAGRYTTRELDEARHPFELDRLARQRKEGGEDIVEVHLDWVHHGLGTGSCGPQTLPEYRLDQKEFNFEIVLD